MVESCSRVINEVEGLWAVEHTVWQDEVALVGHVIEAEPVLELSVNGQTEDRCVGQAIVEAWVASPPELSGSKTLHGGVMNNVQVCSLTISGGTTDRLNLDGPVDTWSLYTG